VHRSHGGIIRHWQGAYCLADSLNLLAVRPVNETGYLLRVPSYEQVPFPVLGQTAYLPAVMRSFVEHITMRPEELLYLFEQEFSPGSYPGDVLKHDYRRQVILVCVDNQLQPADNKTV
jgi:hypothetical protein